jgi:hypothetical protein
MFDISEYLNKFKKISEGRDFLRNTVSEAIKTISGITVDPKNIEVKEGIARIKEKPIVKTEIFLKKGKIIENLKTKTDKITDIL